MVPLRPEINVGGGLPRVRTRPTQGAWGGGAAPATGFGGGGGMGAMPVSNGVMPMMHQGGIVLEDGAVELQAGEHVTPAGRSHKEGEKSEPLMPKASGANVSDVDSKGDNKAMATSSDSYVTTMKPIQLKKKELASAETDWRGAAHDSLCNCNNCCEGK